MRYCSKCEKFVVVYGVSRGAEEGLEDMQKQVESEGKIMLFNPPPFGPYNCPSCGTQLTEKDE